MVEASLTTGLLLAAAPVLLGWCYLAFLTLAALAVRLSNENQAPGRPRLTVLVPAHNEAALIARCVGSLRRQSYPAGQVVVIADNCNDATAAEARAAGASVMVREDQTRPGKGRALRWAMDAALAEPDPPDGIVIVDADSVADSGMLAGLARALASGAAAAQADYTVLSEDGASSGDQLRALAVLLFNRTRNRGRARAGLPASMLGNGMMLSRELLQTHPWSAFSAVEDLEFGTQCRIQGIRPRFVGDQGVRGPLPIGYQAGIGQRLRWEGGRFYVLRRLAPALIARLARHPDLATIDALLDLVVPPLWILVLVTALGLLMSLAATVLNVVAVAAPAVWTACVVLALIHVLLGLKAGDAPRGSYRTLVALPGFFVWKVTVYLRFLRGFDPNRWQRSLRNGEVEWR
jgi:cellulose synthase/poly-beta-1,6-N-acetylglucosamine synthase-like glycosyltransferase